jgi:hypothetical protein
LTNEALQDITERIKSDAVIPDATFGVFIQADVSDECYIRANKDGLLLFAGQLLQAVKKFETPYTDKRAGIFSIDQTEWIDDESDIRLLYIENAIDAHKPKENVKKASPIVEKITQIGCFAILIFLIISLFVGVSKIWRWIFY